MNEEVSIERLKIELLMYKYINKYNTIRRANIYMMEISPKIQKNMSRHNIIDHTFIGLPIKFCIV